MPSIGDMAMHSRQLDPFIGDLPLARIHGATLKPFGLLGSRDRSPDRASEQGNPGRSAQLTDAYSAAEEGCMTSRENSRKSPAAILEWENYLTGR